MSLIDFIPGGRMVQGLVIAAVLSAIVGAFGWFVHAQREVGRDEVRAEWARAKDAQQAAAIAEAAHNAQETTRRLTEQRKAQEAHDAQLAQAQRDAAAAHAAAGRLSSQLAAFTASARRATGNPAAVGSSAATADPIGVLADVFSRADARAGVLAEIADRSRAAGELCAREYDALTPR